MSGWSGCQGRRDPVTVNMPLLTVEAMKMENEICAPRDGTVTAVCVSKASPVETGMTLCTLA